MTQFTATSSTTSNEYFFHLFCNNYFVTIIGIMLRASLRLCSSLQKLQLYYISTPGPHEGLFIQLLTYSIATSLMGHTAYF